MAQTDEGFISTPPATVGMDGGELTRERVVQFLRSEFGDQYQEAYEEGKRNFRDALVREFDLPRDGASDLIDELEQSQVLHFHRQAAGGDAEVPRVGLFDTPETVSPTNTEREFAGRYWAIGREEIVPGTL